jgi:hypothetical protein
VVIRWIARAFEVRRQRRLAAWRATLQAGDRVWVVPPGGNPRRLTIASREGDRFALLLYVDAADGPKCLLDIHAIRLFPEEPSEMDVEVVHEIHAELLREGRRL